jgi:lysophospholipase L1-like esterase
MCSITIGDGVGIANHVSLRDHNHRENRIELVQGKGRTPWASGFEAAPIVIEPMAILSDEVRVLPGVRVGQNTLIGAGAHLRQSIRPNCKVVGDSKSIRILNEFRGKMESLDMKDITFSFFGDSLVDRPAIVVDNPHYNLPLPGQSVPVRGHETAGFYKMVLQRLQVAFPERSFQFLNFAVGGSTIRDVQTQLANSVQRLPYPDVSFICVGINDVMRTFQGRPSEAVNLVEFSERYTQVIDEAQKRCRLVFCIGEPLVNTEQDAPAINAALKTYNEAIESEVTRRKGRNIYFIDLFSEFERVHTNLSAHSGYESLWSDGVHLSDIGNVLAADIIMRHLQRDDIQRALFRLQSFEQDEARERYVL